MPCPDFNVSILKRSDNRSAVAAAAYQSCSRLHSDYDDKIKNYRYKQRELFHEEIMLPINAPPEYADRETLWNAAEAVEKSWNSQLARKIRMALPREVPSDQYVEMVKEFCREQFVDKGMICDFAIHDKGDGNPHVHIQLTLRSLDEEGKWCPKCRKVYMLDENGERIRLPSGGWKSYREDYNNWNNKENCETWRCGWERVQNRYLEMNGRPERVDLRSYKRQGIDKVPTVHMGPAVAALEQKGVKTNIGNLNREIRAYNNIMQTIQNIIRGIRNWITELSDAKEALLAALHETREPTLPELLMQYLDIRQEERSTWSATGRLKGTVADFNKVEEAIAYLREKGIDTVESLDQHLTEVEETAKRARGTLKYNEGRYKTISQIRDAYATLKKYKPIHDAYMKKGFKFTKEHYKEAHQEELNAYNQAYRKMMKLHGSINLSLHDYDEELKNRGEADRKAKETLLSIKSDLEHLRNVRYYVSRVLPEKEETKEIPPEKPQGVKGKLAEAKERSQQQNEQRLQEKKPKKRSHSMEL